ncbi:DUF2182 domain-containing protein [Pseudooceanicola sp. CBS1P-1]|uniref:DUF2182 domain-containing protein n=1 Tax=Pseudooceanicola albus TaxID=2692189 RepID=A0A6L7GA81_9RHOB|nr:MULTISPECIES: DUF2182 domain-containing protein [Pseudooceanicola]MBT9385906.1 DUF2182 domain-containing protein [Pseudooceanicola endophyticus]MXN19673.1 DUF2182 domain-containing protein [Pseudooceanicola albus]
MPGLPLVERALAHERLMLAALMGTLFLLASLYTLFGVGMEMSALKMTSMAGVADRPASDMTAPAVSGMTDMARASDGDWGLRHALLVFLMWWIMMVAMMLPSAAPTVLLHAALGRHARGGTALPLASALFLTGYLLAWAGFSGVATALHWGLEASGLVSASMMTLTDTRLGGALLLAAGIYQFLPMKAACLSHCRSPARFLSERRRPGLAGALRMGLDHGTYCLGCCWGLMALLLVGGVMNLYWIVFLALIVALEKLLPFGMLVSRVLGVGLIAWGTLLLFQAA